jgi:hypothetical protein
LYWIVILKGLHAGEPGGYYVESVVIDKQAVFGLVLSHFQRELENPFIRFPKTDESR